MSDAAFTARSLVNRLATTGPLDAAAVAEAVARLSDANLAALDAALGALNNARASEVATRRNDAAALYAGRIGRLDRLGDAPRWITVLPAHNTVAAAARSLVETMVAHGIRRSEMEGAHGHIADLIEGERLTSDDWWTFDVTAV
jgi:hypothetical protein